MTASARAASIRDGVDVLATQAGEFASGLAGPPWLTKLRRDGVAAFVKAGFPSLHDEEWRYTNLLPLARTVFGLAPRDVTIAERTQAVEIEARLGTLGLSSPGPRLVFVNGRLVRRTAHTLPPEILFENLATALRLAPERVEKALVAAPSAHPFVALNDAFLDTGALVRVGKGLTAPDPLVILHVSTSASGTPPPLMSHLRNLLVRMCPRVADIGNEAINLAAFHHEIAQGRLTHHGSLLARGCIVRDLHVDGALRRLGEMSAKSRCDGLLVRNRRLTRAERRLDGLHERNDLLGQLNARRSDLENGLDDL